MNLQTRLSLALGLAVVLAIGAFFLVAGNDDDTTAREPSSQTSDSPDEHSHEGHTHDDEDADEPEDTEDAGPRDPGVLVHDDSHVLGVPGDSGVEFVEFLDFQCPACAQVHPVVEQLREKYKGRVTFVIRQYPLPSHPNAPAAALAVEAAAVQDKLVEMYNAVFEAQTEWSSLGDEAARAYFRGLARDLDFDLEAYDKAIKDPALLDRIKRDVADGRELALTGTPSIFVNDELLKPRTIDDLVAAIDAALGDAPGDSESGDAGSSTGTDT